MNLPAGAEDNPIADFDPDDPETYNNATSITVYDSLGESHVMTYYFVKEGLQADDGNTDWAVFASVDDVMVDIEGGPATSGGGTLGARLSFNSSGNFADQVPATIQTFPLGTANTLSLPPQNAITNGANGNQRVTIDFNFDSDPLSQSLNEPTQFASGFEVTALEQDGLAVGRLVGIDIDADGLIRASFSNGTSEPISRVALVRFSNDQGLTQVSNTKWKESIASGEALAGEATTGTFGEINSSALEQANVNLTTELIDMIIAQRNFQANSRALEVNNSLNQTILNIR